MTTPLHNFPVVPALGDPRLLKTSSYIANEWRRATSGQRISVTNPADGSIVAEVTALSAADTCDAVRVASRAFRA